MREARQIHRKTAQPSQLTCQQCGDSFQGLRAKYCKSCRNGLKSYAFIYSPHATFNPKEGIDTKE